MAEATTFVEVGVIELNRIYFVLSHSLRPSPLARRGCKYVRLFI